MRTQPSTRDGRPLITFVQPYVPEYRVPLFDKLAEMLADASVRLTVAHGNPTGAQATRGDARLGAWSQPVPSHHFGRGAVGLTYRPVHSLARASDIVVSEFASTNLDTYRLALDDKVRLMLWGHGKAYVTRARALDARLEMWLARRAERLFLYTEGGAEYLRLRGVSPEVITVVRNSTDTAGLREQAAAVTHADVRGVREEWQLGTGPIAAFVGAFDGSKQLPLLFGAARIVHARLPGFQLIVAGAGPQQALVDAAARRLPFVRVLPRADPQVLALIGNVSDCMVIPGRVGLVAVDALALGLPVVTTTYPHHAPEAEYLNDDVRIVANQTARDLADKLTDFLTDFNRVKHASSAATILGDGLTIESMAAAFAGPLLQALQPRRPG